MPAKDKRDEGRVLSDKELIDLERKISRMYSAVGEELQKTIDEYFMKFEAKETAMQEQLAAGKITQEEFLQWRLAYIGRGKRFEELREKVAHRVTKANEVVTAYVNDKTPTIYTLNRNYQNFRIAKAKQLEYSMWTIFDEATVRRLIMEEPDLMPYYPKARALNRGLDLDYGRKKITAITTSAIIQGKSVRKIADDLRKTLVKMELSAAIRTARTALTAAENGGRQDALIRAADMGIKCRKRWDAVKDLRTRDAHGKADGQTVDADKPYTVGGEKLMYPGDHSLGASGWNLYNCRCLSADDLDNEFRAAPRMIRARDLDGKNIIIKDMKYPEYIEMLKKQDPERFKFTYKAEKNKYGDKKQFEEYKALLGRRAPRSLMAFQVTKYRKPEEWAELKALAKQKRKENK